MAYFLAICVVKWEKVYVENFFVVKSGKKW